MSVLTYDALSVIVVVTGVGEAVRLAYPEHSVEAPDRFCHVVPGEAAWDECECGQFTQSIVEVVPSDAFPNPALDRGDTRCGPNLTVVTVNVTLTRCVPLGNVNVNPPSSPTCTALAHAAQVLEVDRLLIRREVTCHLRSLRTAYVISDFQVGTSTTVGPQGACVGSTLQYKFAVGSVCCD